MFLHGRSSRLTSKTTGCSLQACRKSSTFRLPASNTAEPLNSSLRVDIAMPHAALLDCHSVTCICWILVCKHTIVSNLAAAATLATDLTGADASQVVTMRQTATALCVIWMHSCTCCLAGNRPKLCLQHKVHRRHEVHPEVKETYTAQTPKRLQHRAAAALLAAQGISCYVHASQEEHHPALWCELLCTAKPAHQAAKQWYNTQGVDQPEQWS